MIVYLYYILYEHMNKGKVRMTGGFGSNPEKDAAINKWVVFLLYL